MLIYLDQGLDATAYIWRKEFSRSSLSRGFKFTTGLEMPEDRIQYLLLFSYWREVNFDLDLGQHWKSAPSTIFWLLNMAMYHLQGYPWNLNLIQNVEDTVFFLYWKVFISLYFAIVSFKHEMRKSLLQRNHKWK